MVSASIARTSPTHSPATRAPCSLVDANRRKKVLPEVFVLSSGTTTAPPARHTSRLPRPSRSPTPSTFSLPRLPFSLDDYAPISGSLPGTASPATRIPPLTPATGARKFPPACKAHRNRRANQQPSSGPSERYPRSKSLSQLSPSSHQLPRHQRRRHRRRTLRLRALLQPLSGIRRPALASRLTLLRPGPMPPTATTLSILPNSIPPDPESSDLHSASAQRPRARTRTRVPAPRLPRRTRRHLRRPRFPSHQPARAGSRIAGSDARKIPRGKDLFEPTTVEAATVLPANLIEFPRQLIAARKARPRLAEAPARYETATPSPTPLRCLTPTRSSASSRSSPKPSPTLPPSRPSMCPPGKASSWTRPSPPPPPRSPRHRLRGAAPGRARLAPPHGRPR